jgi:hypothetical protein
MAVEFIPESEFEQEQKPVEFIPADDDLVNQRSQFADEIQDPNVQAQLFNLTHNEVGRQGPEAQQAFMETVFNRAASRGQSLSFALNDRNYYPGVSFRPAKMDEDTVANYQKMLDAAAAGSNISNYATGNASGNVGFAGGPQTYSAGGERFGIEGPDLKRARAEAEAYIPTARPADVQEFRVERGQAVTPVEMEVRRAKFVSPRKIEFFSEEDLAKVPTMEPQVVEMPGAAAAAPAEAPATGFHVGIGAFGQPTVSVDARLATDEEYLKRVGQLAAPEPETLIPGGEEGAEGFKKLWQSKLVNLPHVKASDIDPSTGKPLGNFNAATVNLARGFVSGMSSLEGITSLIPPVGVATILANAPEIWEQVKEADKTPAWSQERWEAGLGVVASLATLGLLSQATVNMFRASAPPRAQPVQPQPGLQPGPAAPQLPPAPVTTVGPVRIPRIPGAGGGWVKQGNIWIHTGTGQTASANFGFTPADVVPPTAARIRTLPPGEALKLPTEDATWEMLGPETQGDFQGELRARGVDPRVIDQLSPGEAAVMLALRGGDPAMVARARTPIVPAVVPTAQPAVPTAQPAAPTVPAATPTAQEQPQLATYPPGSTPHIDTRYDIGQPEPITVLNRDTGEVYGKFRDDQREQAAALKERFGGVEPYEFESIGHNPEGQTIYVDPGNGHRFIRSPYDFSDYIKGMTEKRIYQPPDKLTDQFKTSEERGIVSLRDQLTPQKWKRQPRESALIQTSHMVVAAADRWDKLRKTGATDEELKAALASEFGLGGGGGVPGESGIQSVWGSGGKNPKLTLSWPTGETQTLKAPGFKAFETPVTRDEVIQGNKLIQLARRALKIPQPRKVAPTPEMAKPAGESRGVAGDWRVTEGPYAGQVGKLAYYKGGPRLKVGNQYLPIGNAPLKLVEKVAGVAAENLAKTGKKLRRKANKQGGFVNAEILQEATDFGRRIYRQGMRYAQWAGQMLRHLGEAIRKHLSNLWGKIKAVPNVMLDLTAPQYEVLSQPARKLDLSKPENFNAVDKVVPVKDAPDQLTSVDSSGERHLGTVDPSLRVEPGLIDMREVDEAAPGQLSEKPFKVPPALGEVGLDPKTVKGEKKGFKTFIMYLTAATGAKIRTAAGKLLDVCKFRTKECTGGCLGHGGMGSFDKVKAARANKTRFFHYDEDRFMAKLDKDLTREKTKARAAGYNFAVRLNGTSDILWETKGIMEKHPDVQFYDYTKYPATSRKNLPSNYDLTYSYTGLPGSAAFSRTWNDRGVNTAVVFAGGMPHEFLDRPVIDGDNTDLRFLDPRGVIVGLHTKGPLLQYIVAKAWKTGKGKNAQIFTKNPPAGAEEGFIDSQRRFYTPKEAWDKGIETGQFHPETHTEVTPSSFIQYTEPENVAIPYLSPQGKAGITRRIGEAAVDAIRGNDPQYPGLIRIIKKLPKDRNAAENRRLDSPKGKELMRVYNDAAAVELGRIKDNVHPNYPNAAPRTADLTWNRGDPDLGLNPGKTAPVLPQRSALPAEAAGTTPRMLSERAKTLRDEAAKREGGFTTLIPEAVDFGAHLYQRGMDYARWAGHMVQHLGKLIKEHLPRIWAEVMARVFPETDIEGGINLTRMFGRRRKTPRYVPNQAAFNNPAMPNVLNQAHINPQTGAGRMGNAANAMFGPNTPPNTNPFRVWGMRNAASWREWWQKMLPRTYEIAMKLPESKVVSEHQRLLEAENTYIVEFSEQPWRRAFRERTEDEMIDMEHDAVTHYDLLRSRGFNDQAAMAGALARMPPDFQATLMFRDQRKAIDRWAAGVLGTDMPDFVEGPYVARLTTQEGKNVVDLGVKNTNMGRHIRSTIGSFDRSRTMRTMKTGIWNGVTYEPVTMSTFIRELYSVRLEATAKLLQNLLRGDPNSPNLAERLPVLFENKSDAIAAHNAIQNEPVARPSRVIRPIRGAKRGDIGPVTLIDNFGGKTYWSRSRVEAQFLEANLNPTRQTGMMGKAVRIANAFARNPNLMYNPLPHVTKNMAFKYAINRVGLLTFKKYAAQYATDAQRRAAFESVMPMPKYPMRTPQIAALESGRWAERAGAKAGKWLSLNHFSARFTFVKADQAMRYSLFNAYLKKGLSPQEAASHVWIDLIRYDENSGALNAWKSWPFNFFATWRLGTYYSLYKALRSHGLKALLTIGAIEYLREMQYRKMGWWTHLPIDYLDAPLAESIMDPNAIPGILATLALFGPGGAQGPHSLEQLSQTLHGDPGMKARFVNMFWGLSQLYNMPQEFAAWMKDGDAKHLWLILQNATMSTHNAIRYQPRRLMQWLPESLPGMEKSPQVREAEALQKKIQDRLEKAQETYEQRHGIQSTLEFRTEAGQMESLRRAAGQRGGKPKGIEMPKYHRRYKPMKAMPGMPTRP